VPALIAPSLLAVTLAHAGLLWWAVTALSQPPAVETPPAMVGQLVSQAPVTEPQPLPAQAQPPQPRKAPTPTAPVPATIASPSERAMTAPPAEPPASAVPATDVVEPAPAPAPSARAPVVTEPATPVIPPQSDALHLNNPAPVYPAVSRRLREQGRVLLDAHILPDGTVGELKLKRSSGFARLDEAAMAAVHQWRYVPAKRGDQPIAFWYVQPIDFALHP
jgi:periplasmic protein TonB